jgi:hypothetical protein
MLRRTKKIKSAVALAGIMVLAALAAVTPALAASKHHKGVRHSAVIPAGAAQVTGGVMKVNEPNGVQPGIKGKATEVPAPNGQPDGTPPPGATKVTSGTPPPAES